MLALSINHQDFSKCYYVVHNLKKTAVTILCVI